MELVLIRHGQPDFSRVIKEAAWGIGVNFAPLSPVGVRQAEKVAHNEKLVGAELIVSSPYTRALETAAIISRSTGLAIAVEPGLHEWLPDLACLDSPDEEEVLSADFLSHKGRWPIGEVRRWETVDMMSQRVIAALNFYSKKNKIIAICHAAVIYHLTGVHTIPYCCVEQIDYDIFFKPRGWF